MNPRDLAIRGRHPRSGVRDMMRRVERESRGALRPGQDLVIAGYAGGEGARQAALAKEDQLFSRFSEAYVRQMQKPDPYEIHDSSHPWAELGASEWEEAGEGGIYTALWTISGAYMLGFEIDLYRVPVRQDAIEVCEQFDLNPYRLYSKNCMVLAADHGGRLAERLHRQGIPASVIGQVQEGVSRQVCYGQVRGFMERPRQDEIYKVLEGGFG